LTVLHRQFGQRIRQIRDQMDKTQEEFAEITGVSVDFLSLIERGRNAPSFKKLHRMAKGLGKPVAFLFTFDTSAWAPTHARRTTRRSR
jgi:transcriptional regulator with XRE-family HTH domain